MDHKHRRSTDPKHVTRARSLRRNQTDAEAMLWSMLRRRELNGFKFRRQHPISGFLVDFVCLESRLIVEVDGGQHSIAASRDEKRSEILRAAGFRVIRFWNHEVLCHMDGVLEQILAVLRA
jgi:very-short-patch-repair endonuclease